ncbi:hypothetical protein G7B40_019340 [Aetokthonos hydrillicola Thurmond2011]|jgi:hypothetical protein|uniref:Uncharacterized protein n=1 Tax=Aetokthonos hydrillicola Thurmond2011 TaxID=2712845 RepID=A0AAP5I896_9CYAN|nr:hypothetical protein [Aetokthonos hydrillicola]MBO3458876.1 hypothetical protein [Aetokthonos hydrillicola CCALA 1050]MBW4587276.1 hypothetical protein [Aetokthonos hydrillicola CCALA 1050]MDR9896701.1 hypothetical protein [Aetokthonos hydrillicola Thurmond2011]
MDKWQKEFWEMLQTVADEVVDRFLLGMTEMVDNFFELTEEVSEQFQNTIITEVDQYLQELAEPIFDAYWELEEAISDEAEPTFPYSVEATLEQNPACIGCRHYHGQAYNGNLLVCGMHPYGWENEHCPDWEQEEF